MINLAEMAAAAEQNWPGLVQAWVDRRRPLCELRCPPSEVLPEVVHWVVDELLFRFAGLIVEQEPQEWDLRYLFYSIQGPPRWARLRVRQPLDVPKFPSISPQVHAADWHEREAEDLFGITFEGHPRLGDFVLHDDLWQEAVAPMRRDFDEKAALAERKPDLDWKFRRIVHAPGAFAMPVGPVYSGVTESVQFLLETVGEDVIRAFPRLFYKYRAVEKIAEGRNIDGCLLLAERFAATTAFAHALAYCQAVETICRVKVPPRAQALRVLVSELERFRHHVGVIHDICESTGLSVAASHAAILEEDLLRLSCDFTGHRYLFGLAIPGGLSRDLKDSDCIDAVEAAVKILGELHQLDDGLRYSSSFLDRLEGVGIISPANAWEFLLVGPMARASGLGGDLRKAQPYSGYEHFSFDVPLESEGDGFARLRVLLAEAAQAVGIMHQVAARLEKGEVAVRVSSQPGRALGWVEAPRGAAFHGVHLDEAGIIQRYRLITPSFVNWLGFHVAAENFAFQDFPIILATVGLSATENDR
jgi:formate hydrogenlyase subunit 5